MRILLYNFLQPEEPGAGGVGVYLDNLTRALTAAGHDIVTMSAGDRYALLRRTPTIEQRRDGHDRLIVYDSPVVAPAAYSFAHPDIYLDSAALDFLPAEIAKRYGPVDVFHFHNVEGLTRSFFHALRRAFPDARIIFSVHNYHVLCSRVTLWYQNRVACENYREGRACTMCHGPVYDLERVKNGRRLIKAKRAFPRVARLAADTLRQRRGAPDTAVDVGPPPSLPPQATAAAYARFRHENIALFDTVFDDVLAVSQRTRQVLIGRGAPGERISVSYIGTAHHAKALTSHKIASIGAGLELGYIGYMTADKGFPFLLDCLEQMPAAVAATIGLTIAAKNTDPRSHARLLELGARFRRLRYFDGYTHDTLDEVLDGVNLGLIPVLWEDNLPQTAIELVARGIPILTSDRGGAQEIADNPDFIFAAGAHADLIARLTAIAGGALPLERFWAGPMRIFSMAEHVADLMRYYAPSPGVAR